VAAAAFEFLMFSCEVKLCVVVLEFGRRLEFLKIMTGFAIDGKCVLVVISVAIQTAGVQPQVSVLVLFDFFIADKISFVAFFAI